MCRLLLICFAILVSATHAVAVEGSWRGDLNAGMATLPVVLNFSTTGADTSCTLDSPSQGAFGIPATVLFSSPDSVAISVNAIGASFSGRVMADEMQGTFAQRGLQFPLTLKRELPAAEGRPQTPRPPFPYEQIDTVVHGSGGASLSATITLPQHYAKGSTPMCVMVTGSGPQNRDEEIFGHKPFVVIADYLARNGVATLRYDDRGTARSTGSFETATLDTLRDDAAAALCVAKSFNLGPTGILGHSEGGTIALLLAADGMPDFIVSLAGMAVSGKTTVLEQNRRVLSNLGMDAATVDQVLRVLDAGFDEIIRQSAAGLPLDINIDSIAASLGISDVPAPIMQSLKTNLAKSNGYFASLLAVDPTQGALSRINCPVLALNGSLDTQVSPALNLAAIRQGVPAATVRELPGLNHLFQHALTGDSSEYSTINETISPEVLSIILNFISSLPNQH